MEEIFCNQARAYPSSVLTESELDAIRVYEQLKEAIESVEKALRDVEQLLVLWHDTKAISMIVSDIGYFGQTFLVFSAKDANGIGSTALVPAHSAQVIFQKIAKEPGETFRPINFVGHSVKLYG